MEIECVFTRVIEPETFMHISEDRILSELESVVRSYIEACSGAELVEVKSTYMDTGRHATPQPYLRAVVFCENNPEKDLLQNKVSIIGDMKYFGEDVFPIELLGSSYWVDDSIEPSDSVTPDAETQQDEKSNRSFVSKLKDVFF